MADIIAWPLDILLRVTKHVRAAVAQQPLLTIYNDPPDFASPTATALGSGQTFAAHTGASGLGHTVFTKGLVCFGAPRDGPACFLAAPNYRMAAPHTNFIGIQRGVIEVDEDGNPELKFRDIAGGGELLALTFAGRAFHAVYLEGSWPLSTRVATSFDGVHWDDQSSVFPATEYGGPGGAVAFNGDPDLLYSGSYTMAGNTQVEIPDEVPIWESAIENLAWATADPPPPPEEGEPPKKKLAWSYGSNSEQRSGPGAIMMRSGVQNQQGTVAGGKGIFAAATFKKDVQTVGEGPFARQFIWYTAAVASSSSGSSWDNHVLDGVEPGYMDTPGALGESRTIAVVFLRDAIPENSFFICAAYNHYQAAGDAGSTWATVHKSYDGLAWNLVQSVGGKGDHGKNFPAALSVIDADLSNTTIVTLV